MSEDNTMAGAGTAAAEGESTEIKPEQPGSAAAEESNTSGSEEKAAEGEGDEKAEEAKGIEAKPQMRKMRAIMELPDHKAGEVFEVENEKAQELMHKGFCEAAD